jgi:carbon-monoxide dehydrogenase small subunit
MSHAISMTVNGREVSASVESRTLLTEFLRDNLRLTGTHIGCDTSQCGACVVHVNGKSVKSCTMLAVQCDGAEVRTIEGLAKGEELHPMQKAFNDHHGLQCGFCTPGMVMSALEVADGNSDPSDEDIAKGLAGNYCRCTGYENIYRAVKAGAKAMGS